MLGVYKEAICLCDWRYRRSRPAVDARIQSMLSARYEEACHPMLSECSRQLDEYFAGHRRVFDLPLLPQGSLFQQTVWEALLQIPYGQTLTYLSLSQQLGRPEAIRAVAAANGANALSILIPCHRIIGSDGSLTGYAGGLAAKRKLLELEGVWKQQALF